jgi:hypothetical protein
MGRRPVILVVLAVVLAGCGGDGSSGGSAAPVYKRAPTEACLRSHSFKIRHGVKAVGFVAFTSVGGSFRATKNASKDVILAFGNDGADAKQTLDAIRGNDELKQSKIFRYRRRIANVVLFWAYRPKKTTAKVVDRCLRPSPNAA